MISVGSSIVMLREDVLIDTPLEPFVGVIPEIM